MTKWKFTVCIDTVHYVGRLVTRWIDRASVTANQTPNICRINASARRGETYAGCVGTLLINHSTALTRTNTKPLRYVFRYGRVHVTGMLDLLSVTSKFTRPSCHMQPTMRIARRPALLLRRALPLRGQTDGHGSDLIIRLLHMQSAP